MDFILFLNSLLVVFDDDIIFYGLTVHLVLTVFKLLKRIEVCILLGLNQKTIDWHSVLEWLLNK